MEIGLRADTLIDNSVNEEILWPLHTPIIVATPNNVWDFVYDKLWIHLQRVTTEISGAMIIQIIIKDGDR